MNALEIDQDKQGPEIPERTWRLSRRGFLVGMAVTGTAFALGIPLGLPVGRRKLGAYMAGDPVFSGEALEPLLWIDVLPDDRIRLFVPKAELGQGTHTGLAQLAAEELEVRMDQLEVIHASTWQAENKYRGTYGSMSIATLYIPMRKAAATMREMLRAEASKHLNEPVVELIAREGGFELNKDPKVRVTYGALVGREVSWQMPSKEVPLKPAKDFKLIGKPVPRIDGPAKVTGRQVFGFDMRVPDMAYGAMVRPPNIGAKMLSAKSGKAAEMPGVIKVVIENGFVGVVAKTRSDAEAARDALDIQWDEGHLWQQAELEKIVTAAGPGGINIQREGKATEILKKGATLTAEYRTGLVTHATLETEAALAKMGAEGGRVWTSTQFETFAATQVARAMGLKEEQIEVIPTYVGGGFGRKNGANDVSNVAAEAAVLSRAAGVPVHVGWNRAEEMCHGYVRPMTHHRLSARLDGNGHIEAMALEEASGDSIMELMPKAVGMLMGFDPGAARDAWIHYDIFHRDVTVWRRKLPITTGQWRGLGLVPNLYPIECFMDEMSYAAGKDPIRFRIAHMPKNEMGERMRRVLNAAADRAGWGKTLAQGRAQGVACCFSAGSVVAEIAEISLDKNTGRIRCHKVVAVMDCGRAVNPNQVKAQMEGCVVMGLGGAIMEELTVKDGQVQALNFDQYPIPTMWDAPDVETILLDAPDGRPRGAGEPPIGPIAPAIANAFFALTGKRLRRLPMTPERVKEAL